MKLNKEELKHKISDLGLDDETTIDLLEDIEDSFTDSSNAEDLNALQDKYNNLLAKYKSRFLSKEDNKNDEEDEEELKEETLIDITEI